MRLDLDGRQDGPGTPGQVSCTRMESVLSYGEATKPHDPSLASLP